ncbi:MAG: SDR family oxidoreductase [Acidimicrobiales bacterium]
MTGRLAEQVAVVTGGGQSPGSGIGNGRATAITFAREGARVAVVDIDEASAKTTVDEISAAGGKAICVIADVATESGWEAIVARCTSELGGLDIVHHNVGIGQGDGSVTHLDLDRWERIMRINAGSVVLMAKVVVPVMREQGHGVITNISSLAATATGGAAAHLVAYKMSKSAMNALTKSLAVENAKFGIRVNAIAPGLIDTPMAVDAIAHALNVEREVVVEKRNEAVPLRHEMGTAWDVANAALFLASDEARFISGVVLPVDGAQGARVG